MRFYQFHGRTLSEIELFESCVSSNEVFVTDINYGYVAFQCQSITWEKESTLRTEEEY